ncbi:MAG: 2-C-methyl-D-erythritol 4-phosphate cytidylyltransferase [Akkermansiaceae bacterium]
MKLSVIIVAAGSSQRMGFDKLLAKLAGKPVLQHSIEAFAGHPDVLDIIVVCPQDRFDALEIDHNKAMITRVDGGRDRHDSVAAGLSHLGSATKLVAVHDGARPLISRQQINKVLNTAIEHNAATSARPVTETIKRVSSDGIVTEAVSRDHLWLMETPQIFNVELLRKAYNKVQQNHERVTDEVSALELIQCTTRVVANTQPNPKITYPEDIPLAEKMIS